MGQTMVEAWEAVRGHLVEVAVGLLLTAASTLAAWLRAKKREFATRAAAREAFRSTAPGQDVTEAAVAHLRRRRESKESGWLESMSDEEARKRVRKLLESDPPPPK